MKIFLQFSNISACEAVSTPYFVSAWPLVDAQSTHRCSLFRASAASTRSRREARLKLCIHFLLRCVKKATRVLKCLQKWFKPEVSQHQNTGLSVNINVSRLNHYSKCLMANSVISCKEIPLNPLNHSSVCAFAFDNKSSDTEYVLKTKYSSEMHCTYLMNS